MSSATNTNGRGGGAEVGNNDKVGGLYLCRGGLPRLWKGGLVRTMITWSPCLWRGGLVRTMITWGPLEAEAKELLMETLQHKH